MWWVSYWRQASAVTHCRTRTLVVGPMEYSSTWAPGGHHFGTETWHHPTAWWLQYWTPPGQATAWPITDKLPKVVLWPWLPLSLTSAYPVHQRDRPTSTHQCAYISSIYRKPTRPLDNLTHQEADIRSKRSYKSVAWEMRLQNTES